MKKLLYTSCLAAVVGFSAFAAEIKPDLNKFFAVPDFKTLPPEIEILSEKTEDGVKTQSLTFRGADFNGKPVRIFAYYSRPVKEGKYPAVLQIHGAGLDVLHPNVNYPKNGFACLVIDWAGECKTRKVPRKPPTSVFESKGAMATPDENKKFHLKPGPEGNNIRNGVLIARRALDFLRNRPEVDAENIMTVGSSAGAHLSLLLIGYEPRIKASVIKYGTGYIRDLPGYFGGYFGPIYLCPKAEQDLWLSYLDPKHGLGNTKAKVLMLSGTDDIFFWMPVVLYTWRKMPGEKHLLMRPNDNHQWVGNDPMSLRFFRDAMKSKSEWPEASTPAVEKRDGKLILTGTVKASAKIKTVSLVYKTMPHRFEFRKVKDHPWKLEPMKLSAGKWQAEIPAPLENEQTVAYIYAEDETGAIVSGDTVEFPAWPKWRGK